MAKSACIEKISCPDCNIQPNTHLQTYLNEDKALGMTWYTSFCHGPCWENKGDPYGEKVAPKAVIKTDQQIKQETQDIRECAIFKPLKPYRGIPPEFFHSWGCRLLLSEFDGKTPYGIAFPYSDYGKLCGWKGRPFNKKAFYAIGRTANTDPWGLERALKLGGDILWITEGEFDAIALDYCMVLAGTKKKYPVISLTAGGGSLGKNFDYIESRIKRKYKYIVLVLDDDVVGKLAEESAQELWGSMVKVVKKPKGSKDANDAVKAKKAVEMGTLALNFNRN
jgi:hypothetical protein